MEWQAVQLYEANIYVTREIREDTIAGTASVSHHIIVNAT